MQKIQTEPTYNWAVRIDDSLRQPVMLLALNTKSEIRKVCSDAIRKFLAEQTGEN